MYDSRFKPVCEGVRRPVRSVQDRDTCRVCGRVGYLFGPVCGPECAHEEREEREFAKAGGKDAVS